MTKHVWPYFQSRFPKTSSKHVSSSRLSIQLTDFQSKNCRSYRFGGCLRTILRLSIGYIIGRGIIVRSRYLLYFRLFSLFFLWNFPTQLNCRSSLGRRRVVPPRIQLFIPPQTHTHTYHTPFLPQSIRRRPLSPRHHECSYPHRYECRPSKVSRHADENSRSRAHRKHWKNGKRW